MFHKAINLWKMCSVPEDELLTPIKTEIIENEAFYEPDLSRFGVESTVVKAEDAICTNDEFTNVGTNIELETQFDPFCTDDIVKTEYEYSINEPSSSENVIESSERAKKSTKIHKSPAATKSRAGEIIFIQKSDGYDIIDIETVVDIDVDTTKYGNHQLHRKQVYEPSNTNQINRKRSAKNGKKDAQKWKRKFAKKNNIKTTKNCTKMNKQSANELQCSTCNKIFLNELDIFCHEPICGKKRRFECYLCHFTNARIHFNRFQVHMRTHSGDRPFPCAHCDKRFISTRYLNLHMKYHPNERSYACSKCSKEFANAKAVSAHEHQCQLQRRSECYLCKSTFFNFASLKRHMPQHTGQMPFECSFCGQGFSRKEYLRDHLKKHNLELPFECAVCEQRFPSESNLNAHTAICKAKQKIKCRYCDYSTYSKTYAEDHMRKHSGKNEFKCWNCPKEFGQRNDLLVHLRRCHRTKQPHSCPYCHKLYHRWIMLKKHIEVCSMKTKH